MADETTSSSLKDAQPKERLIRVFVSSTFRDMQAEREVLVKKIFPQLRKLCDQRDVVFTDVDLRWGINEEQSAEGQVLPICLAEIERCRPYFIGLLGQRYGWVPESIPQELIVDQPWLAEHRERSVTELEILHGVLNNSAMSNRACFYFRDPSSTADADANDESDHAERLAALKQRIRDSGLPLRENYGDAKALGQMVLEDLTQVINQEFPHGSQPTEIERHASEHERFGRSRTVRQVGERQVGCYVARQEYFDRLDTHVVGDGPPLIVVGESGMGKSALLANWAARYRQSQNKGRLLLHFVGATADSADWAAMLRRILGEFEQWFGMGLEIPNSADALRSTFANALHMAAARGRLILVIDALNQLDDRDGALDLVWLPPDIPSNIRLILSTLSGRPLAQLHKRAWPTLKIEPLRIHERKQLIHDYLRQYVKRLSDDRVEQIAGCQQAANPLYLRALLEELRVFGNREQLDERIKHYLQAETISDLYERILERYEKDYDSDQSNVVRDALSFIWASRRGLSEAELLDLLGRNGRPLPQARWSPLYLVMEQSLISHGGLIGFSHDYFRQAVRQRYLSTQDTRSRAHLRLAEHFDRREMNVRRIDEFPWQLASAGAWARLHDTLLDLPILSEMWERSNTDVLSYWTALEQHSDFRVVESYGCIMARPNRYKEFLCKAFRFFNLGRPICNGVAQAIRQFSNRAARAAPPRAVQCLKLKSPEFLWPPIHLLKHAGHHAKALDLLSFLVKHWRAERDASKLAPCLATYASILIACSDLKGAQRVLEDQEQICRETGDELELHVCLGNMAVIYAECCTQRYRESDESPASEGTHLPKAE